MTFRDPDDNPNQNGRGSLEQLVRWRRDVRRFRADAVPDELVDRLLRLADLAPSVGNSQPWRIVNVRSAANAGGHRQDFETARERSAGGYAGDQSDLYNRLKLSDSTPRRSISRSFAIETRFRGMGSGGRRCLRRSIIRAPAW